MSLNFSTPIKRGILTEATLRDATKEYSGTWRLKSTDDLKVFVRLTAYGTFIELNNSTNLSIKPLIGQADYTNGFRFNILSTPGQLPIQTDQSTEYEIMYYRDTKPAQLYRSGEGQNLNIAALTTQMDRIVMHSQESDDDFEDFKGRVKTIDTFEIPSAKQRADKMITFNADGTKVDMIDKVILDQITVNKTDIAALVPRVAVNETGIANNVTNITTNAGDLSVLKDRVTSNEAQKPIVSQAVANIEALQTVQTQVQSLAHANQSSSAANTNRSMTNEAHANSNSADIVKLYEKAGNNEILGNTNKSILQTHDNNIANNTAVNNVQNAKIVAVETKNTFQEVAITANAQKLTAHDAKFTEIEGNVKDGVLKVHSAGGNVFDRSNNVSGKFAPLNSGGPYAFQLLKPVLDTKVSKISARIKSDTTVPGVVSVWVRAGNVPGSGTSSAKIAAVDVTVNHKGIAVIEFPLTTPITLTMGQEYYLEFWNKSGAVKNLMYDDQPDVTAFSSGWLYEQENAGVAWNTKGTWSIKLDSNDTVQDAILGYDGTHLLINNSPVATNDSIAADVARLDAKNAAQDAQITINEAKNTTQDTAITANTAKNNTQDTKIAALEAKPLPGTVKAASGGLILANRNEAFYGNVGANAVDLSTSDTNSSTRGATGPNSIAMGLRTTASGNYSIAQGLLCSATNIGTHASGRDCQATGFYSSAFGRGCKANNYATFASGYFNKGTALDTLVEIGNGASGTQRANAFEVHNNGICAAPECTLAELQAAPNDTLTTKEYVDSKATTGVISKATNSGLFKTGRDETKYGNVGANAVDLSFSDSPARPYGATGPNSFACGYVSEASGAGAHAEGIACRATATASHAEGAACTASDVGAHAEGNSTVASGNSAHSEGHYTIAKNNSSHAAGKFNIGTSDDTIHETGIGTSITDRKNAFEIYTDGTLTAPEATISIINSNPRSLTTKEYVDSKTAVNAATPASISLQERDAITAPALGTTKYIRDFNKVQRFNSYSSTAKGVWSGAEDYVVSLSALSQNQPLIDSTSSVGEGVSVLGRAAGEAVGVMTAQTWTAPAQNGVQVKQITGVITDKSNGYATVTTKGLVSVKVSENVNDGEYLHPSPSTPSKGCNFTGNADQVGAIGQFIESGQNGSLVKAILF